MSKILVIKKGNEVSYRREDTDERAWLLSDAQMKQVERFIEQKFFGVTK